MELPKSIAEQVELQALRTKVRVLETEVEILTEANYKLKRQHELALTFNWKGGWLARRISLVTTIETLLNYSRKALGQPLWSAVHEVETKKKYSITDWAVTARESGWPFCQPNVWPGQPVDHQQEKSCPDKVEPGWEETTGGQNLQDLVENLERVETLAKTWREPTGCAEDCSHPNCKKGS